jgi:hypothetical protein
MTGWERTVVGWMDDDCLVDYCAGGCGLNLEWSSFYQFPLKLNEDEMQFLSGFALLPRYNRKIAIALPQQIDTSRPI